MTQALKTRRITMSQQQRLANFEATANRVLESIHDLQAGETSAIQRLKSQISSLSLEHRQLEDSFEAPVYLGG
jgi:hypothetical protein